MQYEEKKSLSHVRLANAEDCLKSAITLLAAESYKGAANRCYYAVFHAMRAVLAMDEIDMKHHSGIISEFRKRYLKPVYWRSDFPMSLLLHMTCGPTATIMIFMWYPSGMLLSRLRAQNTS